jgi:hypothetical protein
VRKNLIEVLMRGGNNFRKISTQEVFMFKRLLTILTGLTAAVFFTQSGIAAESHSVENAQSMHVVNKNTAKKKEAFKKKQNQVNAKKQNKANAKKSKKK